MGATLFADPHAAFVPVDELLSTEFNEEGWSSPKLVCIQGRVNIFPHCYLAATSSRPGYWLQLGASHRVEDVSHWREYPTGPGGEATQLI